MPAIFTAATPRTATRIDLRLTQDDLASRSGTTRETVNRVLANLRDRGLIRVGRAEISVLSLPLLRQALGLGEGLLSGGAR